MELCKKVKYASLSEAENARFRLNLNHKIKLGGSYKCDKCGAFHLTTKETSYTRNFSTPETQIAKLKIENKNLKEKNIFDCNLRREEANQLYKRGNHYKYFYNEALIEIEILRLQNKSLSDKLKASEESKTKTVTQLTSYYEGEIDEIKKTYPLIPSEH